MQDGVARVLQAGLSLPAPQPVGGAQGPTAGSNPISPGGLPHASHSRGSGQWGSLGGRVCDKVSVKSIR